MAEIQLNNYSISGLYTYTILYRHYTHSDQVQIKQLDIHKIHLYHLSFNKPSKYLQWFTIIAPFTYIFKMQFATQQVYTQIIPHVYYIYNIRIIKQCVVDSLFQSFNLIYYCVAHCRFKVSIHFRTRNYTQISIHYNIGTKPIYIAKSVY